MIAGVDGCPKGWLIAMAETWPLAQLPTLRVAETFTEVISQTRGCSAVAVDMPIGLPQDGAPRICDTQARDLLRQWGPGISNPHSRVFDVAQRSVINTLNAGYAAFNAAQKELTAKGISKQAFAIAPKIHELDEALRPSLQDRIIEAHPELCFAHLAGNRTLHSKHSPLGVLERCELLRLDKDSLLTLLRDNGIPFSFQEDVIDAMVCLSPAAHVVGVRDLEAHSPRRVPCDSPPRDEKGLRMEIWF